MAAPVLVVTLADDSEVEVTPTLEDQLAFESTLRKNKSWGPLQDNALKMLPFKAWHRLNKLGLTELSWDEFTTGPSAALNVEVKAAEPDEDDDSTLGAIGLGKDTATDQPDYS